jgi:hypothetical protein
VQHWLVETIRLKILSRRLNLTLHLQRLQAGQETCHGELIAPRIYGFNDLPMPAFCQVDGFGLASVQLQGSDLGLVDLEKVTSSLFLLDMGPAANHLKVVKISSKYQEKGKVDESGSCSHRCFLRD